MPEHMPCQIRSANELLRSQKYLDLSTLFYTAYQMTAWIGKDYPHHFEHFYTKFVPGVFIGEREILLYGNDCGVAILKRSEQKICTLYVAPQHRGKGIATQLLERSFEFLGTTQPLISIAGHKQPQFSSIIQKYHWRLTQTLPSSYYGGESPELVYNGFIAP